MARREVKWQILAAMLEDIHQQGEVVAAEEFGNAEVYPRDTPELLSPIVTSVPVELLAHSLAITLDRHPFDYDNATRRLISERTIYRNGESAQAIGRQRHPGPNSRCARQRSGQIQLPILGLGECAGLATIEVGANDHVP